jgi:YggT family protein
MFVAGNLLEAVAQLINWLAGVYVLIVIGRVICSWVNADPYNPIVRFLSVTTDPILDRIRRMIPPLAGLDFSPIIVVVIVEYGIRRFLVSTLLDIARRLG